MSDNADGADTADDVHFVDQGELSCDGMTQEATATVGSLREPAILSVTDAGEDDDGESARRTLANE